jgi:hypothetical protein
MSYFQRKLVFILAGILAVTTSESGVSGAQTSSNLPDTQKFNVIYRPGTTAAEKEHFRNLIKAKVSAQFNDPELEQITVEIPKSCDRRQFIRNVLSIANKNPVVYRAQLVGHYGLN